jgi:hypothetical protein
LQGEEEKEMIGNRMSAALLTAVVTVSTMLVGAPVSMATAPVKLILANHIGWEVNKTTKADTCTVSSQDECQEAKRGDGAAAFSFPEDVGGSASEGNVYVADRGNFRVQELDAAGKFLSMFGKNVNKKGGYICTKVEEGECQAGEPGEVAGAFSQPASIAADPGTEAVYVMDRANRRVDKYTADGHFLWMAGKEVNANGANLCTSAEESSCRAGKQASAQSTKEAAFAFAFGQGDNLAVGPGPKHWLFVADGQHIVEIGPEGSWKGEISLPANVIDSAEGLGLTAVAVDSQTEVVYAVYDFQPIVHEFSAETGQEIPAVIRAQPRTEGEPIETHGMSIDASGHLALLLYEGEGSFSRREFGRLYQAATGQSLTQFTAPEFLLSEVTRVFNGVTGIGFNDEGDLYAAFVEKQEIWSYIPEAVAELTTGATSCVPGSAQGTSRTVDCTLHGEVNPYSVSNTHAWFSWSEGNCSLATATPAQSIATVEEPVPVTASIDGLKPNEKFCYRLTGSDQHSEPPEELTGLVMTLNTPAAAPEVLGQPGASFVTASSVVLSGELNPENAPTEYFVEYAAGSEPLGTLCPNGVSNEACSGVLETNVLRSKIYGRVGATFEVRNLQPHALYHYRLVARNQAGERLGQEGAPFETAAAATVRAETGAASNVTSTGVVLSGRVDPDGQPAVYMFEIGPDEGSYVVVASGSTGAAVGFEEESVAIGGLQPGTTYLYRITERSGYGTAVGASSSFKTTELPNVLGAGLPTVMLPVPAIRFPREISSGKPTKRCKRGQIRRKGRCVKSRGKTHKTHHSKTKKKK